MMARYDARKPFKDLEQRAVTRREMKWWRVTDSTFWTLEDSKAARGERARFWHFA